MVLCPISGCNKKFLNKYALNNHLRKNDSVHLEYYKNNIEVKRCLNCQRKLCNRRSNKDLNGLCWTCHQKNNIAKKKEIKKEWLHRHCFKCKKEVYAFLSRRNTRVLCDVCRLESNKNKREYNKKLDEKRYALMKKERTVQRIENKRDEIEYLYNLLKSDLESDKPIHQICKDHNISLLSIRRVLDEIMDHESYKKRNHKMRSRAVSLRMDEIKKYWKCRKDPRKSNRTPTSIELRIGNGIKEFFPDVKVRYNIWKALKDEKQDCYIHLESDVIINFDLQRIIILCDGEAFHGKESYFNGDTLDIDENKSQILYKNNDYVIRYSETEVKEGFALEHLKKIMVMIKRQEIRRYYRNWMIPVEKFE